jgi:hypothetical protein
MTTFSSGSGSSSGLKCVISFALPPLSWLITSPVPWVIVPDRCTFLRPPALAS